MEETETGVKEQEINRLKSILSLPQETLLDLGLTPDDLETIQGKLVQIERNLLEIEQYKQDNKIEDFSPNPPQLEFLIATLNPVYMIFTYTGGNRRGKTSLVTTISTIAEMIGYYPFIWECKNNDGDVIKTWEKVYEEIQEWEGITWRFHKNIPGTFHHSEKLIELIFPHSQPRRIRIVGQGWEDHIKEVIVPEFYKWWPKNRPVTIKKNMIGIEVWWTDVETQSQVRIMSNDQPVRKFEGWSGDRAKYDEPCKREVYIANARGLVDRDGKEYFAMTILGEAWIDREVIKKKLPTGKADPSVYNNHGTIYDNVGFGLRNHKSIEVFASKLREDEKQARILGIPSYLSGIIFSRFKRETHLVERFKIPLDWMVDIAIDYHPKVEQAVLFMATSNWGLKYLVDEIWCHGNVEEIGTQILSRVKMRQYRVGRIIIDPATKGQGENVAIEKSVYQKWEDFLFRFEHVLETGSKRRTDGIILCNELLYGLNKQAGVLVFDDLVRFLYEIEGWMYDEKTAKPVDKDDHMMENFGRLVLLDTTWEPEEYEEYYSESTSKNANSVTGY